MMRRGTKPNSVQWNQVINGTAICRRFREKIKVFQPLEGEPEGYEVEELGVLMMMWRKKSWGFGME